MRCTCYCSRIAIYVVLNLQEDTYSYMVDTSYPVEICLDCSDVGIFHASVAYIIDDQVTHEGTL